MTTLLTTDYMARIERAVRKSISPTTRVTAVQEWEINEHEGYWERIYIVAWTNEDQSGTHRVNIDSENRSALFLGDFHKSEPASRASFYERVGR